MTLTTWTPRRRQQVRNLVAGHRSKPVAVLRVCGNTSLKMKPVATTVTCKICKSVLKYNKSTSAMHTHLKRHPLTLAGEEQSKSSRQQSISDFTKCPAVTEKRRLQITNLLVNFIVKDIRPLAAVHGEGFRDLLHFF